MVKTAAAMFVCWLVPALPAESFSSLLLLGCSGRCKQKLILLLFLCLFVCLFQYFSRNQQFTSPERQQVVEAAADLANIFSTTDV